MVGIENLKPNASKKRKRSLSTFLSSYSSSKKATSPRDVSDQAGDPFDCSSLGVLPTHDLVENTVQQYLEEWKKLEDRKIARPKKRVARDEITPQENETENDSANAAASVDTEVYGTKKLGTNNGGGWRLVESKLSLPEGFDYNQNCSDQQRMQFETPVPDGYQGDVIISLKNPTHRLSYHGLLSKLFDSIPSCSELEEQARYGHKVDNTLKVYQRTHDLKSVPDFYAVARLRVPDRHGLPQSLLPSESLQSNGRKRMVMDSTIMLECWRDIRKGRLSSGCHRMVVEFLASQTLWDVHVLLSNMAEDELWDNAHGGKALDECEDKEDKRLENERDNCSGCFFIENTFYKTGSVDYAKPIIEWINGSKSSDPNPIRRLFLGLHATNSIQPTKAMKSTKLSDVPFRPNFRYFHSCHGDVETTVVLVDRKMICQKRDGKESEGTLYPLLHDIWTAPRPPAPPICDACQIYQAVFKTPTNCKTTDGGPRSLCQECCQDLNMLKQEKDSVKLYREWNDQSILSNHIARDDSEVL